MKSSLFGLLFGAVWLAGNFSLHAQTNAPATNAPSPQAAREMKMISFLTPAQQQQYALARAKALRDNPALNTEGEALLQQGETAMNSGSAAEKQDFLQKMISHRQKLRTAMLKEDPTLEPVFDAIDKHISQLKAQQQTGGQK